MGEISKADWSWINRAADQFERAWARGSQPLIEDFVARTTESRRGPLVDQLLRVEREIRLRKGEKPTAEEYRGRFPEHIEVVDRVFDPEARRSMGSGGTAPAGSPPNVVPVKPVPAATIPAELAQHPDYEIIRELGRGGMAVVYLAHNQMMGRDEVLKVISSDVIERPGVLDRFLREMRAVASLQHPNIVTAYSAFRTGGSLVFAMEYVTGLDLARMVKAKGPMPVGHACYFAHQAALGLQHAHLAGMVHRDIKPGNLMLTQVGGKAVIKVLDFGLAKAGREYQALDLIAAESHHGLTGTGDLTLAGELLGTPDFIAPEQIANSQVADIRADIYSLGCTLYYLLSGCPPFQSASMRDTLRGHRSRDARPLNLMRPEVPAELAALVARMMAKVPDCRFQTPSEVAKALAPFFKQPSTAAASPKLGVDPVIAPDAGLATADPTRPGIRGAVVPAPAPAARTGLGMLSSLDEFEETAGQSAGLTAAAEPVEARVSWFWPALVVAIGSAAIVLVGTTIFVKTIRPKFVNSPPVFLAEGEAVDDPVEKFEGSEPKTDSQDPPAPVSPPSPDFSTPNQRGAPIPALPPKAPELSPALDVGQTPTLAPSQSTVALGAENAKRIEPPPGRHLSALGEEVERAIRDGVRFLKGRQQPDGSWTDVETEGRTGTTSLITLALLTAGESLESPPIRKALEYLRRFGPNDLHSTYAIALQTMVFAAAEPERDQVRIANNVRWLERAQIKPGDAVNWPGSWTYTDSKRGRPGDNSNTQYALMGLSAASEVGVPVDPSVWELARSYWERGQKRDGSWAYTPDATNSTASMTCAGISSLTITRQGSLRARGQEPAQKARVKVPKSRQGSRSLQGQEFLDGETIRNCGNGVNDRNLQAGIDWLASHFEVVQNFGNGQQWKFYYLYGLERAARLTGVRFFGQNDWYRLGAVELVHQQQKLGGFWEGALNESDRILATSFAVMFLAKGRAPVLINKLRHGRDTDWNNDPDDVRNIVGVVSRDWKNLLTWQVLDPSVATVSELLQAPIVYFGGHRPPDFSAIAREHLRQYVEKGGFILAEACCGRPDFDQGFKRLIKQIFPEEDYKLKPLAADHPVWRAKHLLAPDLHPLWGIDYRGRTVVIYSPKDLSCYWNQVAQSPQNTAVTNSIKIGQNVIDHVTSRTLPPDKLKEQ
jgi:serine/threonine protein kinase